MVTIVTDNAEYVFNKRGVEFGTATQVASGFVTSNRFIFLVTWLNRTRPYGSSLATIVNSRVLGDPTSAPNMLIISTMCVSFPSDTSSFRTNNVPEADVTPSLKNTLPVRSSKSASPFDVFDAFLTYVHQQN